jgi:hypothetical protein
MEGNCEDKLTSISWHVARSATSKYKNIVVTTIGTSLLNLGLFGRIHWESWEQKKSEVLWTR